MPVTIVRVFNIQIKTKQCNIFNRLLNSNILYCILLMLHFLSNFFPYFCNSVHSLCYSATFFVHSKCSNSMLYVIAYFYIMYIYCDGKYQMLFFTCSFPFSYSIFNFYYFYWTTKENTAHHSPAAACSLWGSPEESITECSRVPPLKDENVQLLLHGNAIKVHMCLAYQFIESGYGCNLCFLSKETIAPPLTYSICMGNRPTRSCNVDTL